MSNTFYAKPTAVARHTTARGASLNGVSDAVDAAFEKLPSDVSLQRGANTFAVDSGAADAYVVAMPKTWTALTDGGSVRFRVGAGNTNTGASTINVDGLGARSVRRMDGTALVAGDLTAGRVYEATYDLANTRFNLLSYVSTDQSSINTVAANIANVNTVGGISANVTTVAGIDTEVTAAAGIAANITTVAGVSADVTTVAGIDAAVSTVAADGTDIGVVAGISADIQTLSDIQDGTVATSAISGVASIAADVTTTAGIAANITTAAGISGNITTVAGISANITTVAGDTAAINTVSTNIADVVNVSDNMASVLAALAGAVTSLADLSITATAAEINILDGVTSTTAELNYTDGVTSNIQTQLDAKAALGSPALTGTPTAPTASEATNTTQIATTAFVLANAGGGGLIPISKTTVTSGVAAVDIALTGSYDQYKLVLKNVQPATDAVLLYFRTSTDGVTFDSGAGDYTWSGSTNDLHHADAADPQIVLMFTDAGGYTGQGNGGVGEACVGEILISPSDGTAYTYMVSDLHYGRVAGYSTRAPYGGIRKSATAVTHVRLFYSSGNVSAGTFHLYGIADGA